MGVVERRGGTLLSDYVRSDEKVTIQCENNHEFEMTPSDVKRGRRGRWCPKCSGCCPIQAEERLKTVILERGGTLLSNYVKSLEKVTIQCENDHQFKMTPSSVKSKQWCPKCSGQCPIQAEERLKAVILERGGILLSDYVKDNEKVTIQCENGHEFEMIPNSVKSGHWCPKCSGCCPIQAEERLKAVILERGGTVLSNYVKSLEKVTIQCENGHEFRITPSSVKSGRWCPKCSGKCPIQAEERLKTVILERGGTLLSNYVKDNEKVTIQCENNHKFDMTPNSVKSGCWCPKCSGHCPIQAEEKLKTVILERGGTLLSDYVKGKEKVTIQCENGHEFMMPPSDVKSGCWCPICNESKGERKCRVFLEKMNIEYVREATCKYLGILEMSRRRYDFYVPIYKLLIEYDGVQHFEDIAFFDNVPLKERQRIDERKTHVALEYGYNILRIDYTNLSTRQIERTLELTFEYINKGMVNKPSVFLTDIFKYSYLNFKECMWIIPETVDNEI
ncbi:MAG: hypothetical protein COA94_02040 [Rickettsiales bacterium]|nr:MAG: hypothetical protein COA94_02040 [Rickettsiales bacterium]